MPAGPDVMEVGAASGLLEQLVPLAVGRTPLRRLHFGPAAVRPRDVDGLTPLAEQWRAYADNGRGFAIGLAPHLFHTEEEREFKPNEAAFVANVIYDRPAVKSSLEEVLDRAVELVQREEREGSIGDPVQLEWFLRSFSVQLGVPIIWHAHTTKHEAYRNEQETRLTLVNDLGKLSDYIEVRKRKMELVPFIRHPMPVRTHGSIHEIVIGPSAPPSAEGIVRTLLMSHSLSEVPVRRSNIPYKAH